MVAIRSYGGSDIELEKALMPFYENTKYPLLPVGIIAVASKPGNSPREPDGKSARKAYPILLERLKEMAEERAKSLKICALDGTYLTNISFDEKTKVMKGDLFEPRCQASKREAQPVRTYSGSAERLKEVLQRQLRPIEHFAIAVESGKNYTEALEELENCATSLAENRKLATTIYVANIDFHQEEGIMSGDMLEAQGYSTACELIV